MGHIFKANITFDVNEHSPTEREQLSGCAWKPSETVIAMKSVTHISEDWISVQ